MRFQLSYPEASPDGILGGFVDTPEALWRYCPSASTLRQALSRLFFDVPALYEIRNVRTGEAASLGVSRDGTSSDRAARALGPDWRVFRRDA